MSTNPEIKAALEFDALHEAEKITGTYYKEDESAVWLSMAIAQRQREQTNALLFLNNDTNSWTQTAEEFFAVLKSMGFDLVLREDIPGTKDHFSIFWRNGVLLDCDTFRDGKSINGGKAYFNYRGPRDALNQCSNGLASKENGEYTWHCARDIREGLRFALQECESQGEILTKWVKRPFLWLLHYNDTKGKYDYDAINEARIAKLPKEIQEAITPQP